MCTRNPHKLDSCYSWIVCTAALISNGVSHGAVFSFGVLMPVLMKEFNQNKEKTGFIGSLALAVTFFVALIGGKLCHRYGCQRTHILGTLMCAVSLLATSWATGITFMCISFGVLFGIGLGFITVSCLLIVGEYFQKRFSLAIGFVTAGISAAYFIFGPFAQALIDSVGWRNSYRTQSGLLLGCCCLSYFFNSNVEKKENEDRRHGDRISDHSQSRNKMFYWSILKIPGYTIPLISFTIVLFGHFAPSIHMVRHFEELGVARKRSSYLFIGLGLGSLLSRISAGKICEFVNPIHLNRLAILCSGVCTLLLSINSSYVVLVVLTLVYGVADGAFFTTFNVIMLTSVKPDQRALSYGFSLMAGSVSVAVGPMITGLIADHYSYYEAFLVTGSVTLTGLLVSFSLLCFKKKPIDPIEVQLQDTLLVYEIVSVL